MAFQRSALSHTIPRRRVVVTGLGCISPLGNSMLETWSNLLYKNKNMALENVNHNEDDDDDDVGITSLTKALHHQNIPQNQLEKELNLATCLPSQVAAPVRGVPYDARTSRFVQFALLSTQEALQQASLLTKATDRDIDTSHNNNTILESIDPTSIGVSIATGMGSLRDIVSTHDEFSNKKSIKSIHPHFIPKILPNSPSSRVSLTYKLQGPNLVSSAACAAGAHSIIHAIQSIQYNPNIQIMLCGGSESTLDPLSMAGFCRLRALSTNNNDDPLLSSRPFSNSRDGFVMGEGGAILILEELEHAKMRNANILCEVLGYSYTGDGYHVTSPDPEGMGARRAMKMALQTGGIECHQVDYVNAHATSTPMGDDIEAYAISKALLEDDGAGVGRDKELYVSSTKGATGHLLGAAGSLEAAFTVMSIVEGMIPPTKNLKSGEYKSDTLHPLFRHVEDNGQVIKKDVQIAMSNSFGFGGTNASIVFSKYFD